MRRFLTVAGLVMVLSTTVSVSLAAAADPVIMAAGDIACPSAGISTPGACSQVYTSNLVLSQRNSAEGLAAALVLGDEQYPSGSLSDFNKWFDPSWGRLGNLMRPAPGNHEYETSGASGYFDYFKSKGAPTGNRGEGWYSYDIGSWHLVSLNSSNGCSPVKCTKGSPQETWLRNDLAATTRPCILAYWHHPLSTVSALKDMWQDLYDAGADFVLVGHTHSYKKPTAKNASGASDANGPRETLVGTGGKSGGTYGVLKMTLHANSADWKFVGSGSSDSGSATCRGPSLPPPATKPTASFTTTRSGLGATFKDTSTGTPTSWAWDFGDSTTSTQQNPTHTYAGPGTYTVSLTATNGAGSSAPFTQQVTVGNGPPPASGVTLTDDAKVNAGSKTKNYGSAADLRVKSGAYVSFLKFTVGDLSGPPTAAALQLTAVTQKAAVGGDVYLVSSVFNSSWSESAVTWNTQPDAGTRKVGTIGPVNPAVAGGAVTVTLDPSAFPGNGVYSLALKSTSTSSAYYSSKEGASPARLVLTST
jgi:PKD repeat protein